jgi:MFS family permease
LISSSSQPWYRSATPAQWNVLWAAMLGWGLDGMDVMLYAFALTTIQKEFNFTSAQAGGLASITLLGSAIGGVGFGYIADRYGRARALIYSILFYSIFTAATATSHSAAELLFWRFLVGLGLGGEWAAGSVLVAEVWSAEHRGKAIGLVQSGWALGYIAAALLAAGIMPHHGWRVLFLIGVAPALLTLWVRRHVPEPEIWVRSRREDRSSGFSNLNLLARAPYLRNTALAILLSSFLMFAYWGLFNWIPAYLASPISSGGAGMSIVRSTSWIIPMQVGAFFGYISFGFFADRFGRRPSFLIFVLGAAACVPIYALHASSPVILMLMGPLVGFFGHGYFSVFGAMLAELFPSSIRGLAQGLCYNAGRGVSVFAPATIGFIADQRGIGTAIACTSVLYLAGAAVIYLLPETKGTQLG